MNPTELQIEPDVFQAGRVADVVLVDCREPFEHETVHLPDDVLVPLGELLADPERWADEWADRPVVVYCHHGIRSLQAAAVLRGAGLDQVRSLTGGIDRWSLEIDPSLPRY